MDSRVATLSARAAERAHGRCMQAALQPAPRTLSASACGAMLPSACPPMTGTAAARAPPRPRSLRLHPARKAAPRQTFKTRRALETEPPPRTEPAYRACPVYRSLHLCQYFFVLGYILIYLKQMFFKISNPD